MKNSPCPGRNSIKCQSCSLSELCIPYSLNKQELDTLDNIINRKRPIHKGDKIYSSGDMLNCLYAIRSGTFKTFTIDENGVEQITGFHLPGDLLGFDAINDNQHPSFAQAMETSMVCEIPFESLDGLTNTLPKLRKQIFRMMSNEIKHNQEALMILNHKSAEQRLAAFLISLSERFSERGLSASNFRLTMTRSEIGNYIGLTVETISRLLNRFQKNKLINVNGKLITLNNIDELSDIAGD